MLFRIRGVSPEEEMFLPGDAIIIPLNWKVKPPPGPFGLLMPLNQQDKKEDTLLAGVIDLDYEGETGLLLHNVSKEVRKGMSGIQEIPYIIT